LTNRHEIWYGAVTPIGPGQFTTKCNGDRVIAVKWQISLLHFGRTPPRTLITPLPANATPVELSHKLLPHEFADKGAFNVLDGVRSVIFAVLEL